MGRAKSMSRYTCYHIEAQTYRRESILPAKPNALEAIWDARKIETGITPERSGVWALLETAFYMPTRGADQDEAKRGKIPNSTIVQNSPIIVQTPPQSSCVVNPASRRPAAVPAAASRTRGHLRGARRAARDDCRGGARPSEDGHLRGRALIRLSSVDL